MDFFSTNLNPALMIAVIFITVCQFFIKGVSLWRASQHQQFRWFIALFVLIPFNDLAIVELIYLFFFAKKRLTIKEVKSWIKRN